MAEAALIEWHAWLPIGVLTVSFAYAGLNGSLLRFMFACVVSSAAFAAWILLQ